MGKHIIKPGKVVVMLTGRFAGKKAVVLKSIEADPDAKRSAKGRKYPNAAVVAGLELPPRRVTKTTLKANGKLAEGDVRTKANGKVKKANSVKTFIKTVNVAHIMPTRYNLVLTDEAKDVAEDGAVGEARKAAKDKLKAKFEERYKALGGVKSDEKGVTASVYFFKKLKF